MFRSQRILLKPTVAQERLFRGSAGLSRFAWNWAVAICRRHYELFGRGKKGYKRPNAIRLTTHWNKVRHRRFQWASEYSKNIAQETFRYLDKSFAASFVRLKRTGRWNPPKFHKKGAKDSFSVVPSHHFPMRRDGNRLYVPKIGLVKCVTPMRWPDAKQLTGRIKLIAGRWWLTLAYELPDPPKLPDGRPTCGIDLGCTTFATIASGGEVVEEIAPPKPYAKAKRKLKRMQRRMSRRKKGGNRRKKARLAVAKAHKRVADIRADFLHQLTSRLVKTYGTVVLEDLSVSGMMRGWLSGTIADIGFGEFRCQVEYKAETAGTKVVFADRWYPSSKTCFRCGVVKDQLPLSERVFRCECGHADSRDGNAARNLERVPQSMREVTPVESGGSSRRKMGGAARGNGNTKRRKAG